MNQSAYPPRVIEIMRSEYDNPYEQVRAIFSKAKPGEEILVTAHHRDMHPTGRESDFFILPDRHETPNTFSLKQIIQDALITVCPEVDKDFEEIDWSAAGDLDEAMGYYKFLDLSIQEGYIHAVIKKI